MRFHRSVLKGRYSLTKDQLVEQLILIHLLSCDQVARTICRARIARGEKESCLLEVAPVLLAVQAQIIGGRLPRDYLRRDFPAPWFQVDLLGLLRHILASCWLPGEDDCGGGLLDSVDSTLERTLDLSSASHKDHGAQAVAQECVRLVAAMERIRPDQQRLSRALAATNTFIRSKSANARFAGLECLECLLVSRRTGGAEGTFRLSGS